MVASTEPLSPKVPLLAKFGKPRALLINSVSGSSVNIIIVVAFHKPFTNVVICLFTRQVDTKKLLRTSTWHSSTVNSRVTTVITITFVDVFFFS